MLKNILEISGVQELNKTEQKSLQGGLGWRPCIQKQGLCCKLDGTNCYAGYCGVRGCSYY
ncbi:hypothetical protein [uncultured Aquimarina sp.]|uniref:hypothetical protein n=1 Tax=uncultured Aquimarina sp. TaxID=575652 RepID=UPI0026079002|nr:hypothetical protein [uncultured Aquimarina sp.]